MAICTSSTTSDNSPGYGSISYCHTKSRLEYAYEPFEFATPPRSSAEVKSPSQVKLCEVVAEFLIIPDVTQPIRSGFKRASIV